MNKTIRCSLVLLVALNFASAVGRGQQPASRPADPGATTVDARVADLLGRMTLEEKVAQLCCLEAKAFSDASGKPDAALAEKLLAGGIGEIGPVRQPIGQEIGFKNAVQRYARERTRLGIPVIFHDEGCHGVLAPGATSFPVPMGLACSWDPDLVRRVFDVVGAEMRARGSQHALAPVLDICRDPRWGRTDETMGEDPFLNGTLGTAVVRGLQGTDAEHIGDEHVAVTLKHFAGHGAPEAGVNRAPAHLGPRELCESHLIPFEMVIAAAHPAAVMPSYNEVDGVPSHENKWLLQDVLRAKFGFQGLIASDYGGVGDLEHFHHVAANKSEAALRAFNAGVDMDLPSGSNYAELVALTRGGKISERAVDAAVARVLRLKFQLGLFEHAYADASRAEAVTRLDSSRQLALEAARRSIVLLKNKDDVLPLVKERYKTIAVIGPHSDDARLGSYSGDPWYRVSVLDGIKRKVGSSVRVLHAKGCSITTNESDSSRKAWEKVEHQAFPTTEQSEADIAEAVDVAKQAEAIVLVIGENELISREAWSQRHIGDRASLDLFGAQNELAERIFDLGKPVVVYLMNGRPLAIPDVVERADAVLEGWYMGQETGNAAADILFGDVNPSGKLTITIPRSVGQVPIYYDQKPSSRSFAYVDSKNTPLFPFGFGLSYTKFEYGEPQLAATSIKPDGQTVASVTVTNTGSRAGDEVVQLYVHDKVASVTRPVRELKGFKRVGLAPGASETVSFTITPDMLSLYNIDMKRVVEPGEFEIVLGPSSAFGKSVTLRVEDDAR